MPPEPEPEEELSLSVKNITFATEELGRVIEVTSNTRWTVTYDSVDWFWVITNDEVIGINLLPNYYSTDERTGKVLVKTVSGKITEEVIFTQQGADRIIPWLNNIEALKKHNQSKVSISQGVWGTITLREGECSPTSRRCRQFPVQREVCIYELIRVDQIDDYVSFVSSEIEKYIVATTTCDEEGFFELELEPGYYSMFVREKGALNPEFPDYGLPEIGIVAGIPVIVTLGVSYAELRINYAPE